MTRFFRERHSSASSRGRGEQESPRPLGEDLGEGEKVSFNEAVTDILHLRQLHTQMDETVLRAYGWKPTPGPSQEGILAEEFLISDTV
jgi:hypothetical protein